MHDEHEKDSVVFSFLSKEEALEEATAIYYAALDDGFLMAEADSIVSDSTITFVLKRNQRFLLQEVHVFQDSLEGISTRVKQVLSGGSLNKVFTRTISEYENEGYPFATIRIDSLHSVSTRKGKELVADVYVTLNTGPVVVNDSLYIKSLRPLPFTYVSNYIDFKQGRPYSEQRLQQTEKRLREIPFLLVKRSPEVRFGGGKADLFLFVERKKANYFNAIAGIRPDETTGKTTVVGDAEVRLMNALNKGKKWDSFGVSCSR